jgi:hypothetical protein
VIELLTLSILYSHFHSHSHFVFFTSLRDTIEFCCNEFFCTYMFLYVTHILFFSCTYVIKNSFTNSGDGLDILGQDIGRPITVKIGTLRLNKIK